MINLESIKVMMKLAGISWLRIDFDDEQKCVNAEYIFKGAQRIKKITYQEIIDSLTIDPARTPFASTIDVDQELI